MSADLSFEQIVRDHQAMVFSTLVRLTGSREHLDDLAQEVFLRLYRALPGFRGEALLSTYLYRITVNVAQNEWKRQRRDVRSTVSISDEVSGWEDRLEHPGRNAEEQMEEREFKMGVEEQFAAVEPGGAHGAGPLSSGRTFVRTDRRGAGDADRNGADASASRQKKDARWIDGKEGNRETGNRENGTGESDTGEESGMGDEMSAEERALAELDARLARALEAQPAVEIPEGFAARVAARVPARRPVLLTPRHYGRNAVVACLAVLAVALLALALRGANVTAVGIAVEWSVCAMFVTLAIWLGAWRWGLR